MAGSGVGDPVQKNCRQFKLFMRCAGCNRETMRVLRVPPADDAPSDIDELLESALLQRQRFACPRCQGNVASLTGVSKVSEQEAA